VVRVRVNPPAFTEPAVSAIAGVARDPEPAAFRAKVMFVQLLPPGRVGDGVRPPEDTSTILEPVVAAVTVKGPEPEKFAEPVHVPAGLI